MQTQRNALRADQSNSGHVKFITLLFYSRNGVLTMGFVFMGGFIADPNTSYDRWDAEQAEALRKCPTCGKCGEKIQSEYCWEIEPGEVWCESCTEEWLNDQRKNVEDLMEGGW